MMIAVGGLTLFSDGNRAPLVRIENKKQERYTVRLDDLLNEGEIDADVAMLSGDILIIPEAFF